eukprot:IDg21465t1
MARQEQYCIGWARRRRIRRRNVFLLSISSGALTALILWSWRRALEASIDEHNISARAMSVQYVSFNLHFYSEEQSIHEFRFKKYDIGRVHWVGVISVTTNLLYSEYET